MVGQETRRNRNGKQVPTALHRRAASARRTDRDNPATANSSGSIRSIRELVHGIGVPHTVV